MVNGKLSRRLRTVTEIPNDRSCILRSCSIESEDLTELACTVSLCSRREVCLYSTSNSNFLFNVLCIAGCILNCKLYSVSACCIISVLRILIGCCVLITEVPEVCFCTCRCICELYGKAVNFECEVSLKLCSLSATLVLVSAITCTRTWSRRGRCVVLRFTSCKHKSCHCESRNKIQNLFHD